MSQGGTLGQDVDVASLWAVLRGSAPACIAATVLAGVATFAGLGLVTPRFASETQMLIGGRSIGDRLRDPQVGGSPPSEAVSARLDKEAIASQVIALRSRDLARLLAADLRLAARPEFNSALPAGGVLDRSLRLVGLAGPRAGQAEEDRVLDAYYKGLRVYQGKDSRVITIEFTSADSALAARAANRLAELYQEWLRSQTLSQTADASAWLRPQIETLAEEVREAELEVEQFRSRANLFRGTSDTRGLNEQQLADLGAEVTKASVARGEAEARARSARDLERRGNLQSIPDVQRSPVIQALIAQRVRAERDTAEAAAVLLPAHPRMKQLDANIADVRRQIRREAASIVAGVDKEAKVATLRESLAKAGFQDLKARVGDKAGDVARLAALESRAKAKRRELDALQASLEAARSRADAKAVPLDAQIISRARPQSVAAYPKRMPIASLAAAATLMLGLALAVTRALLAAGMPAARLASAGAAVRPAVERHEQPEQPEQAAGGVRRGPWVREPSRNAGAETEGTIEAAASRLQAVASTGGGGRTLFVGETSEAATHRHAMDLVRCLAQRRLAVVLVEWGCERKSVPGAAGVRGMSDLLEGSASFEDVIGVVPGSAAHIIGWGRACEPGSPPDADRLNLLLDALEEAYDQVVIAGTDTSLRALLDAVQVRLDAVIVLSDPAPGEAEGGVPDILSERGDLSGVALIGLRTSKPAGGRRAFWLRAEPRAEAPG